MSMNLQPAPGAAPAARMVSTQAGMELRLLLRNGEQLLLTVVIPVLLLVALSTVGVVDLGAGRRIDVVTPGILALAVMSTSFTAQAIATGYERRYGVLKLLGATPLPRWGLVLGKTVAVLVIEVAQVGLVGAVALGLGWSPQGDPLAAVVLLVAGTAAFSALGIMLAGLLRAEATLAVANAVYVVLLIAGGTVVPLALLPASVATVVQWLPSAALAQGLRAVLLLGQPMPWGDLAVLVVWFAAGTAVASRTFRWE